MVYPNCREWIWFVLEIYSFECQLLTHLPCFMTVRGVLHKKGFFKNHRLFKQLLNSNDSI